MLVFFYVSSAKKNLVPKYIRRKLFERIFLNDIGHISARVSTVSQTKAKDQQIVHVPTCKKVLRAVSRLPLHITVGNN